MRNAIANTFDLISLLAFCAAVRFCCNVFDTPSPKCSKGSVEALFTHCKAR